MRLTTNAPYTMFRSRIFTLRITTKCVQMADRQLQETAVVVLESIVREHHIYKTIRTPRLGEMLPFSKNKTMITTGMQCPLSSPRPSLVTFLAT